MVSFLTLVFMNHNLRGQSSLIENNAEKFAFYDDGKLITPSADYSKLFISFYEKPDAAAIIRLLSKTENDLFQPHSKENVFSSKKAMTFCVDQKRITSIDECQILIGKIKLLSGVASVYPLLIKDNDYASVENIMIFNITKGDLNDKESNELIRQVNGKLLDVIDLVKSKSYVIQLETGSDVFEQSRLLSLNKSINYVQPNFIFKGHDGHIPNDPYYTNQWFLNQASDADIDAPEAWDITTGSSSIVVAVIDGAGYDLTHTELSGKLVDPYCAANDNNNPLATHPEEKHGTPCAGLIGALTNNNYGVAGVGYNCKVLPIRIGYDFGVGFNTDSWTIQRAAEHIVNSSYSIVAVSNSIGLYAWANNDIVRDAYESMRTQSRNGLGAVILASTMNENQMNPIAYPLLFPHVVGVGASNSNDIRADFSNYGDSTDIVAPGVDCYTLDWEGDQGYVTGDFFYFSGTSAACPIAAGVVALIGSVHPDWSEHQIKTQLYNSCEKVGGYSYSNNTNYPYSTWNNEMGYGRINAYLAVQGGTTLQPPTELQTSVSSSDVHISWTAPSGGGSTEELNINTMPELISLTNGTNNSVRKQTSVVNTILPIENQSNKLRGLLGYNIYRDGNKINSYVLTNTYYDDNGLANGTYNYTVTAVYDEGESNAAGPVQATVSGGLLLPPGNITASNINEKVSLYWFPAGGSEWIYYHDNGFENSIGSTNNGHGSAQLFTLPTYPATLKEVRFYTSDIGSYNGPVEVYILSGNGINVLQGPYITNGALNSWITCNISDVVINEPTFMVATYNTEENGPCVGMDENSYNGTVYFGHHLHGFTELGEWGFSYMGSHEVMISTTKDGKMVNEYIKPDGRLAKKAKDTKRLLYYKIFRNGAMHGTSATPHFEDILPGFGNYNYYVTAYYDQGESGPSNTVTINWNVGIEENTADQISIYPNPATDVIFVDAIETVTELQMLNNRGQIIIRRSVGNKKFSLDVSQLIPGIYLLYFKTNTGTFVKKIVVE